MPHRRADPLSCHAQFDVKARRTFLKKTRYESLPTEQLRPGNTVVVYGRQLKILDYADAFTRRQLEWQQQRCACRVLQIRPRMHPQTCCHGGDPECMLQSCEDARLTGILRGSIRGVYG